MILAKGFSRHYIFSLNLVIHSVGIMSLVDAAEVQRGDDCLCFTNGALNTHNRVVRLIKSV